MDGTLKGVEENAKSMLPQWKRGHFSILFDGATTPNTLLLLDRVRGSYIDLTAEQKASKTNMEEEASSHAAPALRYDVSGLVQRDPESHWGCALGEYLWRNWCPICWRTMIKRQGRLFLPYAYLAL